MTMQQLSDNSATDINIQRNAHNVDNVRNAKKRNGRNNRVSCVRCVCCVRCVGWKASFRLYVITGKDARLRRWLVDR